MKTWISAMVAACVLAVSPAMAGSHGGGKMDDKKVDCSKKENETKPECKK